MMGKQLFKKGQSGNPKGRPKGSNYVDVCMEWAETEGWDRLIGWAEGKDRATSQMKIEAAKTLLAYGYGKPRQAIEHSGEATGRFVMVCPEKDTDKK